MKKLLFLILLIHATVCTSQTYTSDNDIGFHCSVGGSPTEPVRKFTMLLLKSKFSKITKLLESKDISEKFLAAIVLTELEKRNKFKLTRDQIMQIQNIVSSNEMVAICDGCTYFEKVSINDLVERNQNVNFFFRYQFDKWMDYCLKN